MIVFLNGQFVAEADAVVSVFDRGFLYGDGLFEGMLVTGGRIFRWEEHYYRLQQGQKILQLTIPLPEKTLRQAADRLIQENGFKEGILRLSLSRGVGPRGYSPMGSSRPAVVMTLHPGPQLSAKNPARWRVMLSSIRLPIGGPLSVFKTANKLPQILAKMEANAAGMDEAILLNTRGQLVEGTTSNLFWIARGVVHTPPATAGALPGVTRSVVKEICVKTNIPLREKNILPKNLLRAEGIFLSLTSYGVVEVISLEQQSIPRSGITRMIWQEYRRILKKSAEATPPKSPP